MRPFSGMLQHIPMPPTTFWTNETKIWALPVHLYTTEQGDCMVRQKISQFPGI